VWAPRGLAVLGAMVLEVADIEVRPGDEDDFLAAYRTVRDVVASTPGCRSVRMTRGIESPSRFVLLVEWDDVAAHEENFRGTDRFVTWRAAIGPFFAGPPRVEHVVDVG
jgi:heme-degrading monooxygenase HmoA